MKKIRIGIDSNLFNGWGGGIDFIAMLSEALEATGKVQTFLILKESTLIDRIVNDLICIIKSKGSYGRFKALMKAYTRLNEEMIDCFGKCTPQTVVIKYKANDNKLRNDNQKKQEKCLIDNQIDIILPSAKCENRDFSIPRIGYIPDFQHKYLPELFTEKEIAVRNLYFEQQLNNCKYLIVNARDVANDIKKFYPNSECEIIVLPFMPFQKTNGKYVDVVKKYKLPSCYYVVCNQFWMHKDHFTVFKALEELYINGYKDIHVVCTGKVEDARNPDYGNQIKSFINSLKCNKNIHLVGYIPKDDQIEIMKKSRGLIQPTLFEGGPGGGATYNAICLGLTCLVSDIPVNREIIGVDNIFFFEKKNEEQLAKLMIAHKDDNAKSENEIETMIKYNRERFGETLLSEIKKVFYEEKDN